MRALLVLLLLVVATPATPAIAEPRDSRRLHIALTCSIATDVTDLVSTFVAFDRRPDAIEGNFWAYGVDTTNRGRFIAVKAIGAGIFHGLLVWRHDDNPTLAEVLLWSNCAWKGFNTARNLALAFRDDAPPSPPRAALGLRISW